MSEKCLYYFISLQTENNQQIISQLCPTFLHSSDILQTLKENENSLIHSPIVQKGLKEASHSLDNLFKWTTKTKQLREREFKKVYKKKTKEATQSRLLKKRQMAAAEKTPKKDSDSDDSELDEDLGKRKNRPGQRARQK